ncbi:MAG: sigma-54 interaction domain-containing protein [Phycisphaerales bacterium JB060]
MTGGGSWTIHARHAHERVDAPPERSHGRARTTDDVLRAVSVRHCTVLIQGETGAGKEVTARRIHTASPRAGGPFIPVDCTGLRDELMESQLFGHERGAFTGADRATIGFVRSAAGGTLSLDESGELGLALQATLLRVIQERRVVPLGSVTPVPVDARLICATHRDLHAMVRQGRFRQDLLYRLDVVRLEVPPLRERASEIPGLVRVFLEDLAEQYEEPAPDLTESAMALLQRHHWPGNVRELRNAVEHGFVLREGEYIEPGDLPRGLRPADALPRVDAPVPTLQEVEQRLIARALEISGGNRTKAARWLDIDRRRLRRKIEAHGLEARSDDPPRADESMVSRPE